MVFLVFPGLLLLGLEPSNRVALSFDFQFQLLLSDLVRLHQGFRLVQRRPLGCQLFLQRFPFPGQVFLLALEQFDFLIAVLEDEQRFEIGTHVGGN